MKKIKESESSFDEALKVIRLEIERLNRDYIRKHDLSDKAMNLLDEAQRKAEEACEI